jgi:hypothetical protein
MIRDCLLVVTLPDRSAGRLPAAGPALRRRTLGKLAGLAGLPRQALKRTCRGPLNATARLNHWHIFCETHSGCGLSAPLW